jgi:outer membrane protein assembly factor BamD (BamD/ComL family)
LSEALTQAGRPGEAIQALERGAQTFTYSKDLRKHLILSYIHEKDYAKAKAAMEAYVRDFPEDSFLRGLLEQATKASKP